MDISNPLRSVAPMVEADVLAVLARTHTPLSARRVHQLAGRSYSQVHAVLQRLVHQGLVLAERHGNTGAYMINRSHVLADPVLTILNAADAVENEIAAAAERFSPPPVAVVIFGSFARRDGDADSDIDVLFVRPHDDTDIETWAQPRAAFMTMVERQTGNRVQFIELSMAEFEDAVRHDEALIASLRHDGVTLVGALPERVR